MLAEILNFQGAKPILGMGSLSKVLIKKLKKANFLTIQHMMHKEMLKIIEKMRKYTDIKTENGATGQQLRMYDANGKLIE